MFLLPSRRINDYVMLLSWFEVHTPKSHQDRVDLADCLNTLTELDRCIREVNVKTTYTVKTLNIGTPRLTTVVVQNIKQFNFTMQ